MPNREDTLVQIYWAIFETWSAQVDSYWTRTNYFAAFELAAIAGSWVVLDDSTLITEHRRLVFAAILTFSLALILTVAWIFSNLKSYDYHIYWWRVLAEIETGGGWRDGAPKYVSRHEERRKRSPLLDKFPLLGKRDYHNFTNLVVPVAFLVIWVILVGGLIWLRWGAMVHPLSKPAIIDV